MNAAVLNEIKDRINLLSSAEKADLAEYLEEFDEWEMQIAEDMRNGNTANIDRAIERAKADGTWQPLTFEK